MEHLHSRVTWGRPDLSHFMPCNASVTVSASSSSGVYVLSRITMFATPCPFFSWVTKCSSNSDADGLEAVTLSVIICINRESAETCCLPKFPKTNIEWLSLRTTLELERSPLVPSISEFIINICSISRSLRILLIPSISSSLPSCSSIDVHLSLNRFFFSRFLTCLRSSVERDGSFRAASSSSIVMTIGFRFVSAVCGRDFDRGCSRAI
mmetsp:Transcript_17468/g.25840  ORF Transcript_17468/g.25840 Transcript_17468/m.25840 type:complete len:209 (-) Transcript_17468:1588-2214(-)